MNERAERHHEVDVFVAVNVPYVRAVAAFQQDRAGCVDGGPARRRVHALDQRLLCAFETFRDRVRAACFAYMGRSRTPALGAMPVELFTQTPPDRRRPPPTRYRLRTTTHHLPDRARPARFLLACPRAPADASLRPQEIDLLLRPSDALRWRSIAVSVSPGQMQFTRIFCGPWSMAMALVSSTTAPFEAQ